MVGDRYLTDIVFGNRLGMLTVRTQPLTLRGEPKAVLLVRRQPWPAFPVISQACFGVMLQLM